MIYCSYFISFQNVWRMENEISFGDINNRHHIKLKKLGVGLWFCGDYLFYK